MLTLSRSLAAWATPHFSEVLKSELIQLPSGSLPLAQLTEQGGYVDDNDISVSILSFIDEGGVICVRLAIFFAEIVINCGCGDDPMPIPINAMLLIKIDKTTAESVCFAISD